MYRMFGEELKYVPTIAERELLVMQLHATSNHAGIPRTIELIKSQFFWPKMRKDILGIIKKCLVC